MTAKRYDWRGVTTLGGILFLCLTVSPVSGSEVEDRIQKLEAEQRANAEELARLKGEQIELKKEAVAAAAALPTFSYRPRSGVTWAAADRSWGITMFLQNQVHMYNFSDAQDRGGLSTGDLFIRRFRPGLTLCVSDCLYEWHLTMDFDTGDVGQVQNTGFYMNFSKINPWLPDMVVSDEESLITWGYVTRSSTSSAQLELASDLVANGFTGAKLSRRQIGLGWRDKPLVGMPGTFDVAFEYQIGGGITENVVSDTDRKQFLGTIGARPFARSKNPWLERFKLGMSGAVTSLDSRSAQQGRRLRIRTDERDGRLTLLDANGIGDGLAHDLQGGFEWGIGPYLTRVELGLTKYHSGQIGTGTTGFKNVQGGYWRIGHELFAWSPKGLLTGGAYQPGSVQIGWGFQRAAAHCGGSGLTAQDCDPSNADYNNIRLLKRELDLWYYWNSFSRIGFFWNWWDADNVPRNRQVVVGCSKNTGVRAGKDCDWHSVNLALSVFF